MSANTVPATSWSSQLTVYANKHMEKYVDKCCSDAARMYDPSLRSEELPFGYQTRTIAIGTGLVLAAAVETAVLGVFAGASLIVWPVTDKPYKFFVERLDSSSFALVWNLFRIQLYQTPYFMVEVRHESVARFEIANGRFVRDKDYHALPGEKTVAQELKADKLQSAMRGALDLLRNPHEPRHSLDSLDPAQKKILFEYDASKQTSDFIIGVLLKTRSTVLLDETRIQLKILDIFKAEGTVYEGAVFQLGGDGVMSHRNDVPATQEHIDAFKALKNGTKTEQMLMQELFEVERKNSAWKAVHQMLPEQLLEARIEHGAEILADAIFDAHQDRWGDSTYRWYYHFYRGHHDTLLTVEAQKQIQAFKEKSPDKKPHILCNIFKKNRRSPEEIALFFDPSVQKSVETLLLKAGSCDLKKMLNDSRTPPEHLPLIEYLDSCKNPPLPLQDTIAWLKPEHCFLLTHCWDKAAEILDDRLKSRKEHEAKLAARRSDDNKDRKDS